MQHAANLTRALAARRREQVTLHSHAVHLDLSLAKDPAQETFTSISTLMLTAEANDIAVDLVGDVIEVQVDGASVRFRYENSLVHVPVTPGVEHVITITARCFYSRTGEGLHRLIDPGEGETYLYTHYEPTDARRVFACFDQPDMKTCFRMSALVPEGWKVRSNAEAESSSTTDDGSVLTCFAETKPLPTYIVCLIAGPYLEFNDTYERSDGSSVPLRVLARKSMAPYLPTSDLFRWTKAGLAWFETTFNYPYPWGKYDQIFVPEYNIGAMENPGLVTFNEGYLRRGTPSRGERESLATTLLHEMAHMWFGDLVTMAWWDDLWLKESFADFMGTQAASEVTEFTEAWVSFRLGRKAWAFTADGLPTTHPIVADIPDVEAARSNFDGITYAKGACVLRQLAAYVGLDTFYSAASTYFAQHAFSNAGLSDWLEALEQASGRDMHRWSRAWLEAAGTDTISTDTGHIRLLPPSQSERETGRPHRLTLTTFDDAEWANPHTSWVDIDENVDLTQDEKTIQLLDADGWTFAICEPNAATRDALLGGLRDLPQPSWRATAWEQLWQAVRHARLAPETFLMAAQDHLLAESEPAVVNTVMAQAQLVIQNYLDAGSAQEAWFGALWNLARRGFDISGGEVRLAWRKALLNASASASAIMDIHKILDDIGFVDADQDERWRLLTNLAALRGNAQSEDIQDAVARERIRDTSTRARSSSLAVFAAVNTSAAKSRAFESLSDTTLSNEDVSAIVRGLTHPRSVIHARHLAEEYFANLETWWQTRTQVIASLLARGLFACSDDSEAAEKWLTSHLSAPGSLRRIVIEEEALAKMAAAARAMSTGEGPNERAER